MYVEKLSRAITLNKVQVKLTVFFYLMSAELFNLQLINFILDMLFYY